MANWTCSEPYNTAYLEQTNRGLVVAPCCVADTSLYTPNCDLFNQPYLIDIRNKFDNDLVPSACKYCEKNEKKGLTSRRQSSGQQPAENKLKNLEIHLGNYCNLKCVICNNGWSSAWHKDAQAMGLKTYNNFKFNPADIQSDLSEVEWLHFNGGEPLVTNVHVQVLELIPYPEQCSVYYNTNGTIRVDDKIFKLWSKFKLVKLVFSIDDIGQRFNYQRTNADWNKVESNMFWYRDTAPVNMMFGINRTVSRLNQDHLGDLDTWFAEDFPTNRLGDPNDFTQQLASGPTSIDASEEKFKDYIQRLDQLRY